VSEWPFSQHIHQAGSELAPSKPRGRACGAGRGRKTDDRRRRTEDGRDTNDELCLAGIAGASPGYVIIKITADNIRVMVGTDMIYSQVKLK
jgi:hypothetical protein